MTSTSLAGLGTAIILAFAMGSMIRPLKHQLYFAPQPQARPVPVPYSSAPRRERGRGGRGAAKATSQSRSVLDFYVDAGRVHGQLIRRQSHAHETSSLGGRPLVLYFHGNAGNMTSLAAFTAAFMDNMPSLVDLCLFDYSGYGQSGGHPSETALHTDANQVIDYLHQEHGYAFEHMTFWGYSLGGSIAAFAAVRYQPGQLILQATFPSMRVVAAHLLPKYLSALSYLCKGDFDTVRHLSTHSYGGPILMLHAKQDELIPYAAAAEMAGVLTRARSGAAASSSTGSGQMAPTRLIATEGKHNDHVTPWAEVRAMVFHPFTSRR